MRTFSLTAALLTFSLAFPSGPADAQEWSGALAGRVSDQAGGAVAAAAVIVTHQTTGRSVRLLTATDGTYTARDLEPGRYTVRIEAPGFAIAEFRDLGVMLGKTLALDVVLRIAGVVEALEVVAAATPLLDTRRSTVSHHISAEEFDLLPKTRSFQSIAATAPSINTGEIEGGMQVNGASGAENSFTIDGVSTNSLIHARSRQNAAFEYVQEVQVKTTGIPAEFGGALGGVISAVTRSGGNTLRGEAHYYYQGSALSARPVERLVLSPIDDRTVAYVQDAEQPDDEHEPGGSIGGPILRDRLFFFASASPRLVRRSNAYAFQHGADSGTIGQKQTLTQAFGKLSATVRRINGAASLLFTPSTSTGTLPLYDSLLPNAIASSRAGNAANLARGFETRNTSVNGHADIVVSDRSFLTVAASYFRDNYADTGIPAVTSVTYQTSNLGMAGVPPSIQGPTGTQNTPRAMIVSHDRSERAVLGADYNLTFSAAGRHTIKGGAAFYRTVNDVEASYPGGYVFVYWDRSFAFAGTSSRGAYGYYEVHDRGIRGRASANMAALYVQDQWTPTDRLTFNIGVRTENEKIPTYRPDVLKYGLEFGFADKIAPRLGATFDARGDGRVKLFASWGRYYDWTKYELPRDSFGADFWTTRYRALDTLDVTSFSLSNAPGRDLWIAPGSFRDQRVPNFDRVDAAVKPTYQDGLSAGMEHQIGSAAVVTLHYVHNDLRQVIEDVGSLVNGNNVFAIANPGSGNAATMAASGRTMPFATPKVKRVYDAIQLGFARRLSRNWFASANYTYSRLYGNYGGLASADEIRTPTTGASFKTHQQQAGSIANPGGSVNNAWNLDQVVWDSRGRLDVLGRLPTDRPHVVKFYGAYALPFGTDVGVSFYGGSGTPISTYVNTSAQAEVFVNGRGDMGRTPALTQTDLLVAHTLAAAGRTKLRVELTVLNLFDQRTARHLFNYLNRGAGTFRASSAIDLSRTDLAAGYDYDALIRATPDGANAYDPRYGMPDLFNEGRRGQLLLRIAF